MKKIIISITVVFLLFLQGCATNTQKSVPEETNSKPVFKNMKTDNIKFSAGSSHMLFLNDDGTVRVNGPNENGQCNVENWENIISICAGSHYSLGLKADGTVVSTRLISNEIAKDKGQSNVSEWTDIISISAGSKHSVGLKSDGTVVAAGDNEFGQCNVANWKEIIAISAGAFHTVGLRSDGTAVATEFIEQPLFKETGKCDVSEWKDIVRIATTPHHTIGVKTDGAVIITGTDVYGNTIDISAWNNIAEIYTGNSHVIGLLKNGSYISAGNNKYGQCEIEGWTDITHIATGDFYTAAIRSDGTILNTQQSKTAIERAKKDSTLSKSDRELLDKIKKAEEYAKAEKNKPKIGMTALQVKNSSWGEPKKINKTTTAYSITEQWVYLDNKYVYLENGIVTTIQE